MPSPDQCIKPSQETDGLNQPEGVNNPVKIDRIVLLSQHAATATLEETITTVETEFFD